VDIGCGIGLLTVQLALNGATHVCAIDLEKHTFGNALASAFRNEVVHQETAQDADLCPWVAEER
jgi:ribosomal protein L11 methylase PrmA